MAIYVDPERLTVYMGLQSLQGLECTAQVLGGWQVVLTLAQLPNRPYERWIVMRRHSRFFHRLMP